MGISRVTIRVTPFRALKTLLITYLLSPLPLQVGRVQSESQPPSRIRREVTQIRTQSVKECRLRAELQTEVYSFNTSEKTRIHLDSDGRFEVIQRPEELE